MRKPEMCKSGKEFEEKDSEVNLCTLDSARSLEIFKSKIKPKGYGAVTKLQRKKGWW